MSQSFHISELFSHELFIPFMHACLSQYRWVMMLTGQIMLHNTTFTFQFRWLIIGCTCLVSVLVTMYVSHKSVSGWLRSMASMLRHVLRRWYLWDLDWHRTIFYIATLTHAEAETRVWPLSKQSLLLLWQVALSLLAWIAIWCLIRLRCFRFLLSTLTISVVVVLDV